MQACPRCCEIKDAGDFYPKKRTCKACILADRAEKYRTDAKMRERLIARARAVAEERYGNLIPRACRRCGCDMQKRSRTGEPGLCQSCKRLLGYKIKISRADRLAIYERDGWVCQICAKPVDRELHSNDRFAATLDHIQPRSLTLFPDDSHSNLRLAHRVCNSSRGARIAA